MEKNIPTVLLDGGTFADFNLKKFYDEVSTDQRFFPYIFDGWGDQQFYGLKDNNGICIHPRETSYSDFQNNNGVTVSNLFFVADAFLEMKGYYLQLIQTNKFDKKSSIYVELNPVIQDQDLDTVFIKYYNSLYNVFLKAGIPESENSGIKSIDDFMKILIRTFATVSAIVPINRSTFIASKHCPISVNGLTISLEDNKKYSNIEEKVNVYMSDPNFNSFLEAAKRYGFFVDKNAPWRIVADLGSPVMKSYYGAYSLKSPDDVFDKLYYKTYFSDLDTLKNILLSFWNGWVSETSLIISNDFMGNCDKLFSNSYINYPISFETFTNHFPEEWFIRLYLYLKITENRLNISQNKFESMYMQALKLKNYAGEESMLTYINTNIVSMTQKISPKKQSLTDSELVVRLVEQQIAEQPYEGLIF
jgi:hypothetical protein